MHLYLLDIDYEDKEIIIAKTQRLLWNLIPFNPEAFKQLLIDFHDYEIIELDERFLQQQTEKHKFLNLN